MSVKEYAYSDQSVENYLYVVFSFILKLLVNSIFANNSKVSTSLHLYPAKDQPSICT